MTTEAVNTANNPLQKVLVIGSKGQLGSDIVQHFQHLGQDVLTPGHEELDVTDLISMKRYISEHQPSLIINTAAYHNVDLCEENPAQAALVNTYAPAELARICRDNHIRFVHFSTDYVFDGSKKAPYLESDFAHPLNQYGISKLDGEKEVVTNNPDTLIVRVSALYGLNPCRAKNGLNFVQLMLKLANEGKTLNVVGDEIVSPTATEDVATHLSVLLQANMKGIVHLTSEGACSWFEFAKEIFDYTATQVVLNQVTSTFFQAKTPRPSYSVLENAQLKAHQLPDMPHWKTALHNYLDKLQTSNKRTAQND